MLAIISDGFMGEGGKVLDNLRRQCSRREYCCADVYKKALKAMDGDASEAERIVQTLVQERYVDDMRYASAFARDKAAIAGWGDVKIRFMLSSKGIARETIDAALEEVDRNRAASRLEKLIENKYRSLKDDPQWRLKLLRFAMGRGYAYDDVNDVIRKLEENEGL